jgi:hypothetical protein
MESITITRTQLAAALAAWEADAAANVWQHRTDDQRHLDSAGYLIAVLQRGA